MRILFGVTAISGYNYPHPPFTHVPSPSERRPLLQWIARAGFDGLDIADTWLPFYRLSDGELAEWRADIASHGLRVGSLNPYRCIVTRSPQADSNLEKLQRSVEAAIILGAKTVNVTLSVPFGESPRDRPLTSADASEAEYQESARKLKPLARRAAEGGVALSIELHDDGILDSAASCLKLLDMIDEPNVGVNPDIGNLYRMVAPPEHWRDALVAMAPRTNLWHVKNYKKIVLPGDLGIVSMIAPVEDGDIDFRWALTELVRHGFDGDLSIEAGAGDGLSVIARAKRYFEEIVADWLPLALAAPTDAS